MHWRQQCIRACRERGGAALDLLGRRRWVMEVFSRDPTTRSEGEREVVNMVPQGTSAGIIKKAMPKVHRVTKSMDGTLRNQIHDELVGTWTDEAEDYFGHVVEGLMVSFDELDIPLKVESAIGETWLNAKPK